MEKLFQMLKESSLQQGLCVLVHDFIWEYFFKGLQSHKIRFWKLDIENSFPQTAKKFLDLHQVSYPRNVSSTQLGEILGEYSNSENKHLIIAIKEYVLYHNHSLKALSRGLSGIFKTITWSRGEKYPIILIEPQIYFLNKEIFSKNFHPYFPVIDYMLDVAIGISDYNCWKCGYVNKVLWGVFVKENQRESYSTSQISWRLYNLLKERFDFVKLCIDKSDDGGIVHKCKNCGVKLGNYYIYDDLYNEWIVFWKENIDKLPSIKIPYSEFYNQECVKYAKNFKSEKFTFK